MRIAIVSDVHSNLEALDAVLRHAEASGGVDEVETLYAFFGPDGALHGGNRQYYKSDESARERRDILTDEGASAGQMAVQVMERCSRR